MHIAMTENVSFCTRMKSCSFFCCNKVFRSLRVSTGTEWQSFKKDCLANVSPSRVRESVTDRTVMSFCQCVMNWKHLGTYLSHQRHQSAPTGDLQLAEDGMKMFFHRFETQTAFVGNLLIAAAIAH